MSFSSDAKEKICRQPLLDECCVDAELRALMHACGSVSVAQGGASLLFEVEHAAIARRIFRLLKRVSDQSAQISSHQRQRLNKHARYSVRLSGDAVRPLLESAGFLGGDAGRALELSALKKLCCKRSFLRGAFLGCGTVNDPERGYHLEFAAHAEPFAALLSSLMLSLGMNAKVVRRKADFVVYLKEAENIVELLGSIGAHAAVFAYENVRALRGVRNNVNRVVNCDSANIRKTQLAAQRQINSIRLIDRHMGLNRLPPALRDVAQARLAEPDASLAELCQAVDPPIGRSALNHRLRKLEELAQSFYTQEE